MIEWFKGYFILSTYAKDTSNQSCITYRGTPCIKRPIGKSEKCHCNQKALYCVTVTGVTVSGQACTVRKCEQDRVASIPGVCCLESILFTKGVWVWLRGLDLMEVAWFKRSESLESTPICFLPESESESVHFFRNRCNPRAGLKR